MYIYRLDTETIDWFFVNKFKKDHSKDFPMKFYFFILHKIYISALVIRRGKRISFLVIAQVSALMSIAGVVVTCMASIVTSVSGVMAATVARIMSVALMPVARVVSNVVDGRVTCAD